MPRDRRQPVTGRLPENVRSHAARRILVILAALALVATVAAGIALAGGSCRGSSCGKTTWKSTSTGTSSTITAVSEPAPTTTTTSTSTTTNCKRRRCTGSTADTVAPSVPGNQQISGVTGTTVTMTWSASTDNIGVAGYEAWLDGRLVAKTSSTSYTYAALSCGTTYTVGLVAFDAAGNRSDRAYASGPASTSPCSGSSSNSTGDTIAPTSPTGLSVSGETSTGLTLTWLASTDNMAVKGYDVYVGGIQRTTTTATSAAISALACGSSYVLGVSAFDAAGNASPIVTAPGSTASCTSTPTTTGTVVELVGSVSPSTFWSAVAGAGGGPMTVKPVSGATSFAVTGGLDISRAGLRIIGAVVQGTVQFLPGANGSSFENGAASSFNIFGADDVTVHGSTFDGGGRIAQNFIWDQPAGSTPDRFKITRNTIENFYGATSDIHSEGLYVGYSTDGLIEGNTFTNNGNTSHIFFTWFGSKADASSSYPRNICVRGNSFGPTHGAYYAVNIRAEIPSTTGIDVEAPPVNSVVAGLAFSASSAIVRAC